jgi:hypothetical protein
MEHISVWDAANGSKHTVIGVQVGNEVTGINHLSFPAPLVISYISNVASAVKSSPYVVWTRLNCVNGETKSRLDANESQRLGAGTNIDFVGIDLYGISPSNVRSVLSYRRGNYRMIMESGAEIPNAAQYQLAALSGNCAYDYYDMCSPDGHALYDRSNNTSFTPHGVYINDVRAVNKMLNSDIEDIALNAQGYGLFVHNWAGNSPAATTGIEGISFTPATATSQAITILRNNTEIVLMNSKGGTFNYPSSLGVKNASKGHFDDKNKWVNEGSIDYSSTSLTAPVGMAIRLTVHGTSATGSIKRQAEFAMIGGGANIASANIGFAGNGYVNLNTNGGYLQWEAVDGLKGGKRTIQIRFANGNATPVTAVITVNGVTSVITFASTGSWETYKLLSIPVIVTKGTTNTVRIQSTGQGTVNIDEVQTL